GGGTSSYEEIEHTDLILMWGSNARAAHPIFFHHVLKGIHNGATMVVVDPRRTESAEWGDLWLGIDVGTDIALSNTIAREIIVNDLQHHTFIDGATTGFEEYKASVMEWTLARGEGVSRGSAAIIHEGARAARPSPGCPPRSSRRSRTRTRRRIAPSSAGRSGSRNTTTRSTTCCR